MHSLLDEIKSFHDDGVFSIGITQEFYDNIAFELWQKDKRLQQVYIT